ncbi:TraR/DksA C4-type zinc finger protein [Streptomyces sp. NBC_00102]|uniref:TraR/DksA family transcriptional regulator n=1 Tax=Streptomyces sp. NBC_00102 TaxID=2975652 RepID=UPI00224CD355|nr:TraR/DksA C4-type zinc finger protein [Streptomyces sp. NBC_00102]MCX5396483.1 TraR/DksA C4-type zinc finger protein [Streptomyces sp. NBC_00102]
MVAKKTVGRTASAASANATDERTGAGSGKDTGGTRGAAEPEAAAEKPAKKAAAKKAAAKKTAAKKTAAKKTAAGKTPAKKSAARTSTAKKATSAATEAADAAQQTGEQTVAAKKTAARAAGAGSGGPSASAVPQARVATAPGELAVRPGEDPWTPEEVAEARAELTGEATRLRTELEASGAALAGLMRDSGDGAGDDEADTGTKNITREHELSLAAHAQETLEQTERALARMDAGTYGLCEVCGKPIGKARMQAFPRATLCVEDKQKQERRG